MLNEETLQNLNITKDELTKVTTAEVGNIFNFGTHKCEEMNLSFSEENGTPTFVHLGSYGIGITRLMGVIAENLSDEKGLVWPESIAPFKLHLLVFGSNDALIREANELYQDLVQAGIEVLYDDRESLSPGEKLRDADLLGIPYRLVLSEKSVQQGGVEITQRSTGETDYMDVTRVSQHFSLYNK